MSKFWTHYRVLWILGFYWMFLGSIGRAQTGFYPTRTASRCFSVAGVPRLELTQCGAGEVVLVQDAFQGVGRDSRQCYYRRSDCREPVAEDTELKLRDECMGRPSCSITVGQGWMRTCSDYSRYNFVVYQCVPEDEIIDICERRELTTSRIGFIESPGYPNKYDKELDCRCNISTESGQRILLAFRDCSLEWSENCASDAIEIRDGDTMIQRCGPRPHHYNITSRTSQLSVRFRTDESREDKGFWVVAEALGLLRISCGRFSQSNPTTTETLVTSTEPLTTEVVPTSPADTTLTGNAPDYTTYTYTSDVTTSDQGGGEETVDRSTDDGFFIANGEIYPTDDLDDSHFFEGPYMIPEDHLTEDEIAKTHHLSTLVAIIIGVILISGFLLLGVFLIIWFKRRTHTEQISKVPHDGQVPRLQYHRHMFPTSPHHPHYPGARGSPHSSRAGGTAHAPFRPNSEQHTVGQHTLPKQKHKPFRT